jgi:lactate dehydrogenase-like 2-hydroxyacid dehydrogenase
VLALTRRYHDSPEVLQSRRLGEPTASAELGLTTYVPVPELTQVCQGALALIVCCVLNDETRGLVGREVLDALGTGGPGYVVNVARGPVLDYDALHDALRERRIAGAGLDVYWDEPHSGARVTPWLDRERWRVAAGCPQ